MAEFIIGTCRSRHSCNGGGQCMTKRDIPFKKLYTAVGKLFTEIVVAFCRTRIAYYFSSQAKQI